MNKKDFMVILSPSSQITEKVFRLKKACAKHIGFFKGMHSTAHISFGLFKDLEFPGEETLRWDVFLELVEDKIHSLPSINIKVTGFDYFSHGKKSKTIYAVIEMTEDLNEFLSKIKKILYIDYDIVPHITIAKTISHEQFDILWPYFKNLDYTDMFTADCLTVLARELSSPNKLYREFKKIFFQN